jgi:cytidylate kinase
MAEKVIITIGRQFGSGGHEIGEKLAKELGI